MSDDRRNKESGVTGDIISEKDLIRFISRIVESGRRENINESLGEIRHILEREGASFEIMQLIDDTISADIEVTALGKAKKGSDISSGELAKAIRESRERIRREESFRC